MQNDSKSFLEIRKSKRNWNANSNRKSELKYWTELSWDFFAGKRICTFKDSDFVLFLFLLRFVYELSVNCVPVLFSYCFSVLNTPPAGWEKRNRSVWEGSNESWVTDAFDSKLCYCFFSFLRLCVKSRKSKSNLKIKIGLELRIESEVTNITSK